MCPFQACDSKMKIAKPRKEKGEEEREEEKKGESSRPEERRHVSTIQIMKGNSCCKNYNEDRGRPFHTLFLADESMVIMSIL